MGNILSNPWESSQELFARSLTSSHERPPMHFATTVSGHCVHFVTKKEIRTRIV